MDNSLLAGNDADVGAALERRALVCLCGALIWAAPRGLWSWWGRGSGEGGIVTAGVDVGGYVALVGCGLLSLVLISMSWGSRSPSERERRWSAPLTLGLGLALIPWALLAYWIAAATHHRPLGAVTYAAGALLSGLVSVAFARWLLKWRVGRVAAWGLAALALGGLMLALVRGALEHAALRPELSDAALGMLLASAVIAAPRARSGPVTRWAVPVCVLVLGVTLGLIALSPHVRATVKSVPVIAGVVGLALR